ncbi:transposase [Thiohalophilus thiocyanatoxydans]|uniref:Putative transposase n=1 Tax=Thiohalophilus thiocyanatoxydans TaxID=381308 RepID=A0A4R8IQ26_9GAMM|nr:transposase [Thiohalophilus thiocyanatoxydans]TDX99548.1 putative transposase [Thiohalophilus thiocyanatoxydans]
MPRANRHFLPHHVWHITHRCHRQEFLLKFAKDRQRWRYWLYQARKRFGLCVLNYIVTSNHIHLLVRDHGEGEIAESMQLIAGRVAQEYNRRKGRKGAFWEDRYHATAADSEVYLARCMVYVDLNMVRAGVVSHPDDWTVCGYREIQHPPQCYAVIDRLALCNLLGIQHDAGLREQHAGWIETALANGEYAHETCWTQSLAVGGREFLEAVRATLGSRGRYRDIEEQHGMLALREPATAYKADFGVEPPL